MTVDVTEDINHHDSQEISKDEEDDPDVITRGELGGIGSTKHKRRHA